MKNEKNSILLVFIYMNNEIKYLNEAILQIYIHYYLII
jgi:hypothetical protein